MMRLLAFSLVALIAVSASAQSVEEFWQSCQTHVDKPQSDGFYRVRTIGRTPETIDVIAGLILSGEKTGTFTSPWIYEGDRSITPKVGGYSILTDSKGVPKAVLKTTMILTLPFNQITENETAVEGPRARPLEVWREMHVDFFADELEARGKAFAENMPVTIEFFELACRG